MNRRPRRQHRDKRLFRVFQANVGKNGPSHDCALALADAERYEVILLQEPWTQVRGSRCLTKTHPAYDTYSPVSTWEGNDTRPRVMTYIRRGSRLLAYSPGLQTLSRSATACSLERHPLACGQRRNGGEHLSGAAS